MHTRQTGHRLASLTGGVLFTLGLVGDSAIGVRLLTGTGSMQLLLLLLHIPVILLWAWGFNLLRMQHGHGEHAMRIGRMPLHTWSIAALLLGWFSFPGFGPLSFSIALCVARCLRQGVTAEMAHMTPPTLVLLSQPLDLGVQPLIDVLNAPDLEMRRAAVATLSRQADAGALRLLRDLLSDAQPEIRSDASIAVTRLEEELAGALNDSLELWMADQAHTERTLDLADQYYRYARSNVLDEMSQHVYFARARDLLQRCIAQGGMHADLWLKLARIRQELGEARQALQDARTALGLEPHSAEAYLLAMELAFHLHAWEILISLARQGLRTLPPASEARTTLQCWLTLHPEGRGGRWHG